MTLRATKSPNLFERDGHYVVVKRIAGRQHWQALGLPVTADRSTFPAAKAAAAHIIAKMILWHKHGVAEAAPAPASPRPFSTLAELASAYSKANEGRSGIDPLIATRTLATFKLVCREAIGDHDPREVRTDVLTVDLFRKFESARIVAARTAGRKLEKQEANLLVERAQNTVRSAAAKFKSVFQPALLESTPYRALRLPDVQPILKMKVAGSFHRLPAALKPEIRTAIVDRIAATLADDHGLHLALSLAWETGARANTIQHARWDWFTEAEDHTSLRFEVTKNFAYKIRLPIELGKAWQALHGERKYILPGDTPAARALHIARANAWLRSIGVTADKPYHELRKWHGQSIADRYGAAESDLRLGHKPQGVGAKSYFQLESKIVARMA